MQKQSGLIKYITMLLLAAVFTVTLSSCGDINILAENLEASAGLPEASECTSEDYEKSDRNSEYLDDSYSEEFYAYYAQLNESQKKIYCQLSDAVEQGIADITPQGPVTVDEMDEIINALYLDRPDIFWMTRGWSGSHNAVTGYVVSVTLVFNSLANELSANAAAFEKAAEDMLSGLEGLSDSEKEKSIHDLLVRTVEYKSGDCDQSAYSAIVEHATVCEGYARSFQYLMMEAGIPTYVAEGQSLDSNTGNWEEHAWDIVKLGDGFYNIDLTWDDPIGNENGYIYYRFYNRTDSDFAADHIRCEYSMKLPVCDAEEYSYEKLYSEVPELAVADQMGLTREGAITSADDFYRVLKEDIISEGTGAHTYAYAVSGEAVMDEIAESMSGDAFFERAIQPAIESFHMNGYSFSSEGSHTELGNGYYYVSLQITIK